MRIVLALVLMMTACSDRVPDATYAGHLSGVYDIMGPDGPVGRGYVVDETPAGTVVNMGERDSASSVPTWVVGFGSCQFFLPVTYPGRAASWVSNASSASPLERPMTCALHFRGLSPSVRVVTVTMMQAELTATGQLTLTASVANEDVGGRGTMGLSFIGARQ